MTRKRKQENTVPREEGPDEARGTDGAEAREQREGIAEAEPTREADAGAVGLKVVLMELSIGISVGVSAEGCDPVLRLLSGLRLEEALAMVPEMVAQAQERWAQGRRYPAYQRPTPPAPRSTVQARTQGQGGGRQAQEPQGVQQRLM